MCVYRLHMGAHVQTGVAACFAIDDYERDVIKKHEKTRPDKRTIARATCWRSVRRLARSF